MQQHQHQTCSHILYGMYVMLCPHIDLPLLMISNNSLITATDIPQEIYDIMPTFLMFFNEPSAAGWS